MRPVIVIQPATPESGGATPEPRAESERERRAAIGELAAGLALDFNNLLTSIRASCDLLLAELDAGDSRREEVAAIARTSAQATTLARALVTLGRDHRAAIHTVDLPSLVSSLEPIMLRFLERGIQLVTDVEAGMPPVLGDHALIERALLTLAVQAGDAMPFGGRLTVSVLRRRVLEPVAHRRGVIAPGEYGVLAVRYEGGAPPDARGVEPLFPVTGRGERAEVAAYFPVHSGL